MNIKLDVLSLMDDGAGNYAEKIGPGSIVSPKNRMAINQSKENENGIKDSEKGPLEQADAESIQLKP